MVSVSFALIASANRIGPGDSHPHKLHSHLILFLDELLLLVEYDLSISLAQNNVVRAVCTNFRKTKQRESN